MTRTREQIVEEIIDAVQDLFDNAEPTDESQIYQEYYYIPSRPGLRGWWAEAEG